MKEALAALAPRPGRPATDPEPLTRELSAPPPGERAYRPNGRRRPPPTSIRQLRHPSHPRGFHPTKSLSSPAAPSSPDPSARACYSCSAITRHQPLCERARMTIGAPTRDGGGHSQDTASAPLHRSGAEVPTSCSASAAPPASADPAEPLEALLGRLAGRVSAVFSRYNVSPQDRDDVLQRTLTRYVECQPRIEDPEAWLMNVLARQCLMYHRRERSRRRLFEDTLEPNEFMAPGGQGSVDLRLDLTRALRRLSPQQQRLAAFRFLLECSSEEAAALSGYRPSVGRKLIGRIRRRLSEALSHDVAGGLRRKLSR